MMFCQKKAGKKKKTKKSSMVSDCITCVTLALIPQSTAKRIFQKSDFRMIHISRGKKIYPIAGHMHFSILRDTANFFPKKRLFFFLRGKKRDPRHGDFVSDKSDILIFGYQKHHLLSGSNEKKTM